MNGILRFGLAGTGVGASSVAQAIESAMKSSPIELSSVYSRSLSKAEDFGKQHSIRSYFSDYEKMIKESGIDAVIICSPHYTHYDLARIALENDLHVLVDKPIALSLRDADDIIRTAKKRNRRLGVIFQSRFAQDVQETRKLVQEGKIGKVLFGNVSVLWYRSQEYYANSSWRGRWSTEGGGVLINQAIHTIDLLLWTLGGVTSLQGSVDTVSHNIEVEDRASALLKFKSGAVGTIEATTSANYPGYPSILEFVGTQGRAVLEGNTTLSFLMYDGKVKRQTSSQVQEGAWTRPDGMIPSEHAKLITDFAESVLAGRDPMVDGVEGRKALELVLAIYKSSKIGRVVNLTCE
jgi:predicted dehydrogenase